MMKLGAHNSIAGGLHNAVAECVAIGGEAFQMPCGWKTSRQFGQGGLRPPGPRSVAA